MSYSTVSSELCAPSQFYYDLYCIGISVDLVIGFDFALLSRRVFDVLCFGKAWTSNIMMSTDGRSVIRLLCINTNNDMSQTTHESYSFGDTRSEPLVH